MTKRQEIKDLGEVKKILGLKITRDRAKRIIKITQIVYTDELITEYGLIDAREARTLSVSLKTLEPMSEKDKLANIDYYRRVIGKLLFLMRGSRPDICFTVSRLSRYVAKPAKKYQRGVMQVLRYAKGTRDFGISFLGLEDRQKVKGYVDSDYAGDCMDRRSTYGSVFILLGGPLAWYSRK